MSQSSPSAALPVCIDYTSAIRQGAGIGRYTRELVRALLARDPHTAYLLLVTDPRPLPPPLAPNARWCHIPFSDVWLQRLWHRAGLRFPVQWLTGHVALFHQPDFVLPPVYAGTPTLLTVHDLTFIRDAQSAPAGLRRYLTRVVPASIARATHVLADSIATRADVLEEYGTPPEKVTVVYAGVDAQFQPVSDPSALATVRARYQIPPGPFVLGVGTLQPRKNYTRLVQAFARVCAAPDAPPDLALVLAGGRGWLFDALFAEIERLGLAARVRFPGFVADADLPALYSAASVLAYPSLYEGFGLPIIEAFACGTPVVASNASCLPEVAGVAALLVPPHDTDALAAALLRALQDTALRAILRPAGFAQARRFTWEQAAATLAGVYTRLLKAKS